MKPRLRRALAATAATALSFATGELLVRACVPARPPMRFAQDLAELERFGRDDAHALFVPDEELFWRLAPDLVLPADAPIFRGRVSNAQGLREEGELPPRKPAGELRVLFLGDSCTFGTGLALEQTYVHAVEAELRRRLAGEVECIDAGVPGYTLWQGVRAYERFSPLLEPDLVVVAFGWNDGSRWDGLSDEEHARSAERRRPPGVLAASRLARLAWERLGPAPERGGAARPRVSPQEYADLLARLERRTRARGQGLLVLVWPVRENFTRASGAPARDLPLSDYQAVALRFARSLERQDAEVLDLCAPMAALARELPLQALYQDHVHATARAHAAFAVPIADWISRRYGAGPLAADEPR